MESGCSVANNIIVTLPATIAAVGAFLNSIRNRRHIQGVQDSINGQLSDAIHDAAAHGTLAGLRAAETIKNGSDVAATERASGTTVR